jgi:polysaccharide biosynthesis/export protein
MKQHRALLTKPAFLLLIIVLAITSCVPQKKIKYLQKVQKDDTTTYFKNKHDVDYKLQPKDNIYVRVFSLDEKTYMFFNKQSGSNSYNDYANDASIYLNSYGVDFQGYIDFPIVGKVYVKDLTAEQVKEMLQKLIDEYLRETTVIVKVVNFRVTVLGEVARPGEFKVYQDDLNIFEALSLAGDMTEFANRNKVAVIRKTKAGSTVRYVNLTSDLMLSSDFYYLQPNDIIYIAPLGYKRWGLGSQFPWAIILASVTTTLLLINYIKPK